MTPDKRVEEIKKEFVKDFCEVKPYRDTELIYFKGFCEKNYNLVPTPKTIMLWIEEALTQHHQDLMSEVVEIAYSYKETCHESNWQRGCVSCVESQRVNTVIDNIVKRINLTIIKSK